MNKASSLFVLIILGSLVADAVAQVNPQGPRRNPPGQQQGQPQQQPQQPQAPTTTYQQPAPQAPVPTTTYQQPAPTPQYPQQPSQGPTRPIEPYPTTYQQPGGQYPGYQQGRSQIMTQQVLRSLRSYETLRLSEVLRLSMSESRDLEVLSVSVLAQGLRGQVSLDLRSRGRSVSAPQLLRRQLSEVRFMLPAFSKLDDLEISASDESIIDTITVEVRSSYQQPGGQYPQVMQPAAGELLKLNLHESIRMSGEINLKQIVRQQLGLNLEGAQIERIVISGQQMYGRGASVQVLMNNRFVAPAKMINASRPQTPIPLNTIESVEGSLKLLISGDIIITDIGIRVGQVRRIR